MGIFALAAASRIFRAASITFGSVAGTPMPEYSIPSNPNWAAFSITDTLSSRPSFRYAQKLYELTPIFMDASPLRGHAAPHASEWRMLSTGTGRVK